MTAYCITLNEILLSWNIDKLTAPFLSVGVIYCAPAQTALSLNSRRAQYMTPPQGGGGAAVKNTAVVFSFSAGVAQRHGSLS